MTWVRWSSKSWSYPDEEDIFQTMIRVRKEKQSMEKRKLISLSEFNDRRRIQIREDWERRGRGNGISCPSCGFELFDSVGEGLMMSNPPQKHVECLECRYRGERMV